MKSIVLSFSQRDQSVSSLIKEIKAIRKEFNEDVLLIHGNLPRDEAKIRNKSTELLDKLFKMFPIQLNLWKEGTGTLREEMAYFANKLKAPVYVIGREDGHIAEEIGHYKMYGLQINYIPLK